jgi:hypothetical protein
MSTQRAYYYRLLQMKPIFEDSIAEDDWTWLPEHMDEQGRVVGVIQKQLMDVNLFRNEDWPGHHFVPEAADHRPG